MTVDTASPDQPSQEWVLRHQRIWREKKALRSYYEHEYFRRVVGAMVPGRSLEIGAGPGFFAQYRRSDIVTDITPAPHVDRVVDVHAMPFADSELANVVGIDVVHHFEKPAIAFSEIARVLAPGGRLVLVEPWTGWLGHFFYDRIHHEDCFAIADPWAEAFPSGKDPMDGNAAIPKTYFCDRAEELTQRTGLHIVELRPFSCFGYLATGGFTRWAAPFVVAAAVRCVEGILPAWLWHACALKVFIIAEKM